MIDIEKMEQVALAASSGYRVTARFAALANLQNMLDPSAVLELITRLKAAEQDAVRWNWMLERMSGKDVMIFAQRPAWPAACCDDIVADMDKVMKESK